MPGSLYHIYITLRQHFGSNPAWWPIFSDDGPFEMLLGAVLVQQTRWETVEQAILRLRAAGLLAPQALAEADARQVATLLRPVAFYTQKAAGIIAISAYLCERYDGMLTRLLAQPTATLRRELLSLQRIGPETADVILLYAGGHPVFVIDEYTRRVFGRIQPALHDEHPLDWRHARYDVVQKRIEHELTWNETRQRDGAPAPEARRTAPDSPLQHLYADYHALINEHCVRYCLARNPRCDGPPARRVYSIQAGREAYLDRHDGCPLRAICAFYQNHRR